MTESVQTTDGADTTGAAETATAAMPAPPLLVRSLAVGAATGARSATGLAAVALTSTAHEPDALVARLGGPAGTVTSTVLALGELVADQLPSMPSRLAASGLVPRLLLGAAAAAAIARRSAAPVTVPALVGVAGALGAAVAGTRWRALAHRRFGSDWPGALAEDAVAALLAWYATRTARARLRPARPPHPSQL